ncbi:MAG: hypothetical protein ACRDNL_07085 [Spirillospora sp.]
MVSPITALEKEAAGLTSALPVQRRMPVQERSREPVRLPDPPDPPESAEPRRRTGPVAAPAEAGPVQRRDEQRPQTRRSETRRTGGRRVEDVDVDELVRHLIGPLTRLLRAELRMDRERIGRLRDPRNY